MRPGPHRSALRAAWPHRLAAALLLAAPVGSAQEGPLPAAPGEGATHRIDPAVEERLERLDPDGDDWPAEIWNVEAGSALKVIGARLAGTPEDLAAAGELAVPGFRGVLRPALGEPTAVPGFRVRRPDPERGGKEEGLPLGEALAALRAPFGDEAPRPHFKVTAARRPEAAAGGTALDGAAPDGPDVVETEALYLADTANVQQRAHWTCLWRRAEDGSLLLADVRVRDFEEVRRTAPGTLFEDCSEALFAGAPAWREQILPGLPHWREHLDSRLGVTLLGHQGIAVGDHDGDGREDLYVCQTGGLPNRLFRQEADGTARDVAARAGLDFLDASRSALWLDLDDDGDQDLVVAFLDEVVVFENDGEGVFTPRAELEAATPTSLAAADHDLDGDLDLYVCSYVAPYDDSVTPTPYHDANNGQPNSLFRNDGSWRFEDVTAAAGLDENNRRFSFAAAWEDVDNDGDPDLYVANDFGRNNLYLNEGGRFTDVAARAGVEDISAGMGVTFADADGDGWMDLYVSNMFSSAGHRVTYSRRFEDSAADGERAAFQRHARGNSFFLNAGDGTFRDASLAAGVTMGRWAWGALFADLNNDGREDLVVPNGFVTGARPLDDL